MKHDANYIEYVDIIDSKIVGVDLFNKKISIRNYKDTHFDKYNYLKPAKKDISDYINNIRQKYDNIVFGIVTTHNCNLACTYCYEKNFKGSCAIMTLEKCHDICNYIINYVNYYNPKNVRILFTGGEPLLNKEVILYVMDYLSSKDKINTDTIFMYSIVTNGTIALSDSELEYMINKGLNLIQVSLDGSRDIHNKRRVSNFDAYQKTFDFIKKISNFNLNTVIRTNIDPDNIDSYEEMLCELIDLKNKITLSLYLTEKSICDRCINNSYEQDDKILFYASDIAEKKGFKLHSNNLFFNGCMSLVEVGQFIDPQGNIYKCGGLIGHDKENVGNIYDDFYDSINKVKSYIDKKLLDKCYQCKMFPLCTGGCIYNKYNNTGCDDNNKIMVYNKIHNNLMLYFRRKGIV